MAWRFEWLPGARAPPDQRASWRTTMPGVHAAGDIAAPKAFVAVAAASGAQAALALDGELAQEDFGGEWSGPLCSREAAGQA